MAKELQVGEQVKIKTAYINDMVPFICGTYMYPHTKEFDVKDFPEIRFWIGCYLDKTNPVGEVVGHGCEEERSTRRNVKVRIMIDGKPSEKFFRHASVTRIKK